MCKNKNLKIFLSLLLVFIFNTYVEGKKNIGIQLYSLREDISKEGIEPILEKISNMGYENVEAANYKDGKIYGLSPEDFKTACFDNKLIPLSAHVSHAMTEDSVADMEWWGIAIKDHINAGMKYIILPWLQVSKNPSVEEIKKLANYMNAIGKKAKSEGIIFGYHNHEFEFTTHIGDKNIFDLLVEYTNPEYVCFQMDVYPVVTAGDNPVKYLKKYKNRISLLHIKDETAVGADNKVNFKAVFKAAYASGIEDWFVEVSKYKNTPFEDVKASYEFLNKCSYVK